MDLQLLSAVLPACCTSLLREAVVCPRHPTDHAGTQAARILLPHRAAAGPCSSHQPQEVGASLLGVQLGVLRPRCVRFQTQRLAQAGHVADPRPGRREVYLQRLRVKPVCASTACTTQDDASESTLLRPKASPGKLSRQLHRLHPLNTTTLDLSSLTEAKLSLSSGRELRISFCLACPGSAQPGPAGRSSCKVTWKDSGGPVKAELGLAVASDALAWYWTL